MKMKRIFTILMLLCTVSAFATSITSTYNGKLTVSVDGATPTIVDPQSVKVVEDGSSVKLTISNFSYAGLAADVNITASKDLSTGDLTLKTISYAGLPLTGKFNSGSKLINNKCEILLTISAIIQTIEVTFTGTK